MKNKNILLIVIGLILLFGGYFLWDKNQNIIDDLKNNKENQDSTTIDLSGGATTTEKYQIEEVPINQKEESGLPLGMPNLNREPVFSENLPDQVVLISRQKIKEAQDILKTDPANFYAWLDLGINLKVIGDYDGAIDVWVYAGKIRPNNSVSFANLGLLYGYELNDPVKAELNLKKAVENSPEEASLYLKLADFYREVLNDLNKAKDILDQGLKQNPDSAELKTALKMISDL